MRRRRERIEHRIGDIGCSETALKAVIKGLSRFRIAMHAGLRKTRFRETRRMKNSEGSTELECTEYVSNEKVRFVADQGGVIWDSVFFTTPVDGGTELILEMDARPYKLMPRLMLPLVLGMISKAVEADMDAVKSYCERDAA